MRSFNGHQCGRRPRVLELAGPAGAGKSTLSGLLSRKLNGSPRSIWGLPVLPLLTDGVHLIPAFTGLWLHSRSLLWEETTHMVRLRTLARTLGPATQQGSDIVIFDEGPVFALARLRGFGHETMRGARSAAWWEGAVRQWASLVDTVVVLDVPDQLLATRIRGRPRDHEVRGLPDREIAEWMGRFREALEWVLLQLTRDGGPQVVRLSGEAQPAQLAENLLEELSGSLRGR